MVCIPSFRRPQHLRLTLESLAAQRTDRRFAVVIVENDAAGCGSVPVAAEFLRAGRFPGLCVIEPQQGNCHAINAAFETAMATFPAAEHFLMIDDDEIASQDWLELMVRSAEASGADLVGGPVQPNFDDHRKRGLRRHPAFRPAYDSSGVVPIIYGCGNCLITRAVFERLGDPAFDVRFNFLGGGDTDFFVRCRQAGMKFYWAAEALITETVPQVRTSPSWLALRGLRIGAINYHIEVKAARTRWSRARLLAKMLADAAAVAVSRRAAGVHRAQGADRAASDRGGRRQRVGGDRYRTAAVQGLENHLVSRRSYASCARTACATSCHQRSKSNRAWTVGHFSAEAIRSA